MTYENYPIQYAEFNLITPNPASDAILEEYNRQFVYHTFCDLPSETEELIVIDAINAFFDDEDDDAMCQNDPILLNVADKIDPSKQIDRLKLNMLLLDRCDGLKVVYIDIDGVSHFIITKDAYTMAGLVGARLVGCGVEPDHADIYARNIADELALNPSKIKAVILDQVEAVDTGVFDFDDDYDIEGLDDDIDVAKILKHLRSKRKEKALLEKESCPAMVEIHDGDNVRSINMDDIRAIIKDVLVSKQEQDSFLKIAAKILYDCYDPPNTTH